jgi:diadenosine tetraphosphate (Ap4A) HIT family hydrolase
MTGFVLHQQLAADSVLMRELGLSQLRLHNIKTVPWLVLVPRRAEIKEIHQLEAPDRAALMEEIAQTSRALMELYAPDKINVAALGNIVPQLHVHVIARFTSDPAWPNPVFGRLPLDPYAEDAIKVIAAKLNADSFWK